MIEIVKGLPDNILGIVAKGRVTKEDCSDVLRPAMERSLKRHERVRLYYEIGSRFPGAGWEGLEIGLDRLPQWEKIAVVTDTGWVRQTVNALRFLLPTEVRVFTCLEANEGRAWIAASDEAASEDDDNAAIPPFRAPVPPHAPSSKSRSGLRPIRRGGRRYRRPAASVAALG